MKYCDLLSPFKGRIGHVFGFDDEIVFMIYPSGMEATVDDTNNARIVEVGDDFILLEFAQKKRRAYPLAALTVHFED